MTWHNCDGKIGKLLAPYTGDSEPGWYIWLANRPLTIVYCPVCGEKLPEIEGNDLINAAVNDSVAECRDIALKFAKLCKKGGLFNEAAIARQVANLIEARFD